MKILKITEDKRSELTDLGIVICTYNTVEEGQVDGIDIKHKEQYPNFPELDVTKVAFVNRIKK